MAEMTLAAGDRSQLAELLAKRGGVLNLLGRQTLLERAGLDRLLTGIDLADTAADTFSWNLIRELQVWGTLAETGQPALVALVRELRRLVRGHEDEAAFLDRLLAPYDAPADGSSTSHVSTGVVIPPTVVAARHDDGATTAPLAVLFLAANPRETDALCLGAEARTIEERLGESRLGHSFDFRQQHAVRWSDVSLRLLRHEPRIVHFAGHGTANGELVFETDDGAPFVPPAQALGDLFGVLRDNIRCVVLNACWSKGQARAISQHIDCVVGMTRPVADDAALRFAAGFYRGIGFGRSVRTAFDLGRNEMAVGSPDPSVAMLPVLLARDGVDAATTVLIQRPAGGGNA